MTFSSSSATNRVITVIQGSYQVSDDPQVILSTVLGSCVSVCLYDDQKRVGGMNHFLLAQSSSGNSNDFKYGVHAMEMLINDLLKRGARRSDLRAKLFGGATMNRALGEIGANNARFGKEFLENESIPCIAECVGGSKARKVQFWPTTGDARQMLVPNTEAPPIMAAPQSRTDEITLF